MTESDLSLDIPLNLLFILSPVHVIVEIQLGWSSDSIRTGLRLIF